MDSEISVSVICTAYNHKRYIRAALEGFVSQKTSFKYEVLVHDDASTDGTADIIRRYEKKYPDLIRAVYQKENQYSKGVGASKTFLYPLVRGRYVALCEGDDYWIDPHKLQKQFDALEKRPDMEICTHGALMVRKGRIVQLISPATENCVIPTEQVIAGGGGFVATNSIMIRTARLFTRLESEKELTLDYTVQIRGSYPDGMLFLKDVSSVYNLLTEGSWSERIRLNPTKFSLFSRKMMNFLNAFNLESNYVFDSVIKEQIRSIQFHDLSTQKDYKRLEEFCTNERYSVSSQLRIIFLLRRLVPSSIHFDNVKKVCKILAYPVIFLKRLLRQIYQQYKFRKYYKQLKYWKTYLG